MKFENSVTKYVGAQIRKYRKARGMTQKELGFRIGVKHNTISGYESGTNEPEQNILFAIADVLGVSINDLFPSPTNVEPVEPKFARIPVLGTIACGEPILAEENISEYIYMPIDRLPSGKLFYLRAKGSSMEPTIPDGSLVLIREQPEVEPGAIAAVLVNGDTEATLKRIKRQGDMVILMPDNPEHEPIVITPDNPARIIGRAVQVTQLL
ncbi:LexA family protein [Brevibacillus composti]|uniref:Helix-turn-helix domain-containing protein n=1 Tax=Brevibacillus composti TaxID=2796470 RepID=A0A7T5JPH9_9BACL|nr:XRE family transcriptional regulator [Brevibacillus composti]QQE75182.1 helix-turn-helix domain-containing protein [Brevibacillus composti]